MYRLVFKTLVFVFVLAMISSCLLRPDRPKLPEETLKAIFLDFHTAEHMINRAPSDLKDSLRQVYRGQIFEIHQVDRADFQHDLDYFEKHPDKLADFYERLSSYSDSVRLDLSERLKNRIETDM
jgi:hypothetical protein